MFTPTLLLLISFDQSEAISKQQHAVESQRAALNLQRTAVRRQVNLGPAAEGAFFVTDDPAALSTAADCEPLTLLRRRALVDNAAKRAGITPQLLEAVMEQESAFRPCSVSVKGAVGLMQLMPSTSTKLGVMDPFDPDENTAGGASLLKELMDRYSGDLNRVLGAYNAGTTRVDQANGVPSIPETEHYVETIMSRIFKRN